MMRGECVMREMKNRTFAICVIGVLTVFTVLMCWGCSRRSSPPAADQRDVAAALSRPFDAKATIKLKDLVMTADVNRTGQGQATIQINEPKTLSGMAFAYDGQDIRVSYKGLTVKLDENSKLVSSVASIIVNSIDAASSESGVDVRLDGGALVISGESDSGRFQITLDKENGSIATLNVPELDFECRFDDFLFQPQH